MSELIQYDLSKPAQTLQLAAELQRFVKEQKLTVNIKGKSYPLVESWQFAGSQLGLIPIIQSVQNISTDSEVKYSATVEVIRIADGLVVSRGFAICSNKEGNKRTWDEYAICSMAQTRATGKAFRNILSWLMKAAGFEATPAEEMDFNKEPDGPTEDERKILRDLVFNSTLDEAGQELALASIESCTDYKRYQQLQYRLELLQKPIDQIANPSQKEINKHLKKTIK
jgi:hypothetical protein